MTGSAQDSGAKRRALVRAVFGKPGSMWRWLAFTVVWVAGLGMLMVRSGWGLRIIIFLFMVVVPLSAFRARALLVGDEDEFRAAVRREVRAARTDPQADGGERLDPEYWLSRGGRVFTDVPPPPVAEDLPDDARETRTVGVGPPPG